MATVQRLNLTGVGHCSRPKNVGEVAYQDEVVQTLERAMDSANVGRY